MKKIIIFLTAFLVFICIKYNIDLPQKNIIIENKKTLSEIDFNILSGAKKEIKNQSNYKSAYYSGGYPPKKEGVCSDVIWRALSEAGINLKKEIDLDIKKNTSLYPRVAGKPDPNIDFRRVANLFIFFQRKAINLTKNIIPGDIDNLSKWQAGDIVVFGKPKEHIAIISDKRNKNGVPYIIHNSAPIPREDDWLIYWHKEVSPIIGHYRRK